MNQLLSWYAAEARSLPWRTPAATTNNSEQTPNPYAIWVSEIMLQQTRVDSVIPYFEKWMARFPTITSLANSSLHEVLSTWEGLGYYSRARNLHRAAVIVEEKYNGTLPRTAEELIQLPGIGRYTAGAIASIAFGLDEPALDGNIRRVLSRYFNVQAPARSTESETILWKLAADNLPLGHAAEYNQALMDLGATVCTPRSPACITEPGSKTCPLVQGCQAFELGIQEQLPVQTKKAPIPHHTVTAAVIYRKEKVLIAQRPFNGLLGGMWEFPGGKRNPSESLKDCLRREICEELNVEVQVGQKLGIFQHAYTHFQITLHAYQCQLLNGDEPEPLEANDIRWVNVGNLSDFPMGKIDRMISEKIGEYNIVREDVPD